MDLCDYCQFINEKCSQLFHALPLTELIKNVPPLANPLSYVALWNGIVCEYRAEGFSIDTEGFVIDNLPEVEGTHKLFVTDIRLIRASGQGALFLLPCELPLIIELLKKGEIIEKENLECSTVEYSLSSSTPTELYFKSFGLPVQEMPKYLSKTINDYFLMTGEKLRVGKGLLGKIQKYRYNWFIYPFESEPE